MQISSLSMQISSLSKKVCRLILSRLLIRSLLRFRCVSRSLDSLIRNQRFIRAQGNARPVEPCILLRKCHVKDSGVEKIGYSLRLDQDNLAWYRDLKPPQFYCRGNGRLDIVGSCMGVVCFVHHFNAAVHNVILWNPTLGERVLRLPDPLPEPQEDYSLAVGLGYDHQRNDLKAVRICRNKEQAQGYVAAEIFSMNNGSWRSIDKKVKGSVYRENKKWQQLIYKGVIHWLLGRITGTDSVRFILSYNPALDSFDDMVLPEVLGHSSSDVLLMEHKDSLAIFLGSKQIYQLWKHDNDRDDWKLFIKVDFGSPTIRPIGFIYNGEGEVLVEQTSPTCITKIGSFDPQKNHLKFVAVEDHHGSSLSAIPHRETLFLASDLDRELSDGETTLV